MSGDNRLYSWQQAITRSGLPPTTRHVLLTLALHMNAMGESCYPSTATQAAETGLSERAVITHLEAAEAAGWLVRERHGFAGQKWARMEYRAAWPEGYEIGQEIVEKGTEPRSAPPAKALNVVPKGTEPDDKKALNVVQSNYPVELSNEDTASRPHDLLGDEPRRKVKRPLPPDWRPSEAGMHNARMILLEVEGNAEVELAKFLDWCAAKGQKYIDFEAAFRNWCRNAVKFAQRDASKPRHAAGGRRYEPMPF